MDGLTLGNAEGALENILVGSAENILLGDIDGTSDGDTEGAALLSNTMKGGRVARSCGRSGSVVGPVDGLSDLIFS